MKLDRPNKLNVIQFPDMPKKLDHIPVNRVRELRLAAELTLAELAAAVGTTTSHIQRLETGGRDLNLGWMERISRALNCLPADLLLPEHGGLAPDERDWIETGRAVPSANRAAINTFMEHQKPFRHDGPADIVDLNARLAPPPGQRVPRKSA
jgi:transcriptional regulator with XRE-family HTH domain